MSVTDEHWLGLESAQAKGPTSRKQREKWGTLHLPTQWEWCTQRPLRVGHPVGWRRRPELRCS